ncbi:MAG: bifunctional (p)ppGpp synthetase/guanosine-3',5'-bis(diphosphate) 3'-pyrophosphohydrolase [Acidobacteria bacterium]|nr:bifunctional (p)ppGpp synthetase/guanosine-3',5'-bis(diphosphate) 3'-pyrophosphohydrolase [Acidobacteriota bacterium]MBS1813150.1 bifunctional (p)ppGpp synthetase/guanosine-3',5'-bis(diphosphate) 3'-pyrophosphohydrolase [Acidobacteriota bacterium]
MIRFEDVYRTVGRYYPDADLDMLRRAYIYSAREHKDQVRQSGEPYLIHPLSVAGILAEMKMDVATVSTGFLHDVVEDTLTTIDNIKTYFGEEIAHLVDGVTKISNLGKVSKEQQQAESLRKMVLAMVKDLRVVIVKLADRLHNMRTLDHLPAEKRRRIAQETLDVYSPIAHRLGMGKIRAELEDLSFKYLEPDAYKKLQDVIERRRSASDSFLEEVKTRISQYMDDAGVELVRVEGRIKRLYSIYLKMKRQKITLDQVYDLMAMRLITKDVRDCYAALGVIHQHWHPVPGRIKDFIATPRENLYQSLHTSVVGDEGQPFEVQIRTEEMHRIAEEGIAAHWKYKEGKLNDHSEDDTFKWLRHLVEWQQEVPDSREFMAGLKLDLYPKEVYAFTPKGKVIQLPRGATPVDFAFAIHTEVGNQCTGAKVNGRIVPLKYELHNGEVVEIMTTPGHHPSRDWLNFVVTSRARNKIRHWLTEQQRAKSVDLGRKLFEKEASRLQLKAKKVLEDEQLARVLSDNGFHKIEDMFAAIGYGKLGPRSILVRFIPPEKLKELEQSKPSRLQQVSAVVRRALRLGEDRISVKGIDEVMVYRARCCNPIRGEAVIGYITQGKGVAVHARRCKNAANLMINPERIVDVDWVGSESTANSSYAVKLVVTTEDRQGMLADLTLAIANIKTNIRDVHTDIFNNGSARIDVTVEISDVKHLDRVIGAIKGVSGVIDVERTGTQTQNGSG